MTSFLLIRRFLMGNVMRACGVVALSLMARVSPAAAGDEVNSIVDGAKPGGEPIQTIAFGGSLPDMSSVEIDNSHVYDYTFASAPTDWHVQSGIWEMTNRWNCSPGWSWFGGRSSEVASVWNKRRFQGDLSVQYYYAFKMGLSGSPHWAEFPSDAAVTICGDGSNLSTGYTFIMGADQNKHSLLLRNGVVVAESTAPAALLPVMADGKPKSNDLHRRWWYVRVNKVGSLVECWLDNALVFSYRDPEPLDRGQMALWTYNNGIMLSRVQIYYQNEVRADRRFEKSPGSELLQANLETPPVVEKVKSPVAEVKKVGLPGSTRASGTERVALVQRLESSKLKTTKNSKD